MARQLTAAAVAKLKPGRERRQVLDGGVPGLYLQVQPSGHKSWIMRFRKPSGAQTKMTLGRADVSSSREPPGEPKIGGLLTLAAARQLAAEVNRRRAQGRDVVADSKHAKTARRPPTRTRSRAPPRTSSSSTPSATRGRGRRRRGCSAFAPTARLFPRGWPTAGTTAPSPKSPQTTFTRWSRK